MKKILLFAAAIMLFSVNVKAQNGYDNTKHEIGITYGFVSNSQWLDVLEEVTSLMVGVTTDNEKFSGPIGVEYFYHAKNWLSVGGIFTYGKSTEDYFYIKGQKEGEVKHTYYTIMPAVKFDWLRKEHFGMYSKLGVGATIRTESVNGQAAADSDSKSNVHFNWQASLLGIEAGGPQVRCFAEVGVGEQGVAAIGIRYKF